MKGCKVLNKAEIDSLLNVTKSQRERMLVLIGLYFGTRISETLSLTFEDFNGQNLQIKRKKGSDTTKLTIPSQFHVELAVQRNEYESLGYTVADDTPIFLSREGHNKPLQPNQAMNIIRDMVKRAGIEGKVGAHSFRKCFTTKIYELCGYDIMQTAKYTGHRNLSCLQYYIETTKEHNLTTQLGWT